MVVAGPLAERRKERLGDQVVGFLRPGPAGAVPVQVRRVAVEKLRETLGLAARGRYDLRVGLGHTIY